MLFNSYPFLFAYLPVVLLGYYLLARAGPRSAVTGLMLASLVFYAYWDIRYLPLLCGSILVNYWFGRAIATAASGNKPRAAKLLVAAAVVADLGLLSYFKYADFFINNLNAVAGSTIPAPHVILPLGISFFTFTQLAFIVDVWRGSAKEYNLTHYALFASYFPHLIAGPILHHKELIPQFYEPETYRFRYENIAKGLAFFAIGLFKKVALADGVAQFVGPVFGAAAHGTPLTFLEGWGGALCYTLQLYFDFSGYCDMAIGLSWLFNVRLPFNFDSPYKALSIVDFWRRWHMTLSRFLRDYLYIALGGNRRGAVRRYVNLFATMLLGGLWHGANWTFVFWGALHGAYLVINHAWRAAAKGLGFEHRLDGRAWRVCSGALTLFAVIVGWTFFRADSIHCAFRMLTAMSGADGIAVPSGLARLVPGAVLPLLSGIGVHFTGAGPLFAGLRQVAWIGVLFAICLLLPNSQQMIEGAGGVDAVRAGGGAAVRAGSRDRLRWAPSPLWAAALGLGAAWCLLRLAYESEFLYFQF